jgi:hypothetical protein
MFISPIIKKYENICISRAYYFSEQRVYCVSPKLKLNTKTSTTLSFYLLNEENNTKISCEYYYSCIFYLEEKPSLKYLIPSNVYQGQKISIGLDSKTFDLKKFEVI